MRRVAAVGAGSVLFSMVLVRARADDPVSPAPAKDDEITLPAEKSDLESAVDAMPTPGEIVVSTRRGVPLTYAGGRDVIESDTLQRYPDGNISTVLRRVPGITVLPENGNDSRIAVGLRGNDPRRSGLTTILVDGVPASEAVYGNTDVDALPITFERIWRVDVIRGGASIRWGPNSAGGVVNFITEPIPDAPMARVGARYGSDNDWSVSTTAGGTWDQFGTLVSLVGKGGDGFRENSEYEDHDGSIKLRWLFNERDSISATVSRFTELDAEQPGGLTQAEYEEDPEQSLRPGADFRYEYTSYKLDFVHEAGHGTEFQLIGWWYDGDRGLFDFRPIVGPFTVSREQHSSFKAAALEARYSWNTEIFGLTNTFFHSARYLIEKNRELYQRIPLSGGPANRPYDLDAIFQGNAFSLFNEDTISVTDDVALALGLRTESIDMNSLSRDTTSPSTERLQHYSEFLPAGSLTWTFVKDAALYASYQENFLTPQYETGFDPTSPVFRDVEPEDSATREVGTRVRALPGMEFTAAYFKTDFTNKIDFVNLPSGDKVAVNTGEVKSHGLELGANYGFAHLAEALDGFSAYATLTNQRSTIEAGEFKGNDSPHSPHRLASWGLQYDHSPTGLWARIGGSYTSDQFKEADNFTTGSADGVQGPEPSYSLWDTAVGWRQCKDGSGLSVSVGVTNLLDEAYYRRFVSGIYPGAPRQLFAAASYTLSW